MEHKKEHLLNTVKFTTLILEEERYVRRYIGKKLYDPNDADDAYQTTLLEAYRFRKGYRGDATPRVWICGIANNIAMRFNREYLTGKKNVRFDSNPQLIEYIVDSSQDTTKNCGVEGNYQLKEMWDTVETTVDSLDCELKNVFSDVIINGESYRYVADKYSIPIGTVKSRIAKVRERLRAICER